MSQLTDAQLITEATVIKTETALGANTADRVGTMFVDSIDSKINTEDKSQITKINNTATPKIKYSI